jgi:hypothetical protein
MGGCARGSCSRAEASLVVSRFDRSGSGRMGMGDGVCASVGLGYSVLSREDVGEDEEELEELRALACDDGLGGI